MHRTRGVTAVVLIAVGAVWVGQGLGLLRGSSFMVDDVRWAVAGALVALVGLVVVVAAVRAGRRSPDR